MIPFLIVFGPVVVLLIAVAIVGRYYRNWRQRPECDCCGKRGAVSKCFAFGIETYACDDCRGMS